MKYALVSGASGDIGQAICVKLALEHGYHVLVHYHKNIDAAKNVLNMIITVGGTAELMQFNVADRKDVEEKFEVWWKSHKDSTIEVIINNAGVVKDGLFVFLDEENWDSVIDVKLKGFYNITKVLLPKILLQRYGRIINVASLIGLKGGKGQVNYAAANGGLIAATKALASEIGKRNVTVNAVAPGYIKSNMTKHLKEEELSKLIPTGRFGTPEEVADLVSFLVSNKASYINGEIIRISGGL